MHRKKRLPVPGGAEGDLQAPGWTQYGIKKDGGLQVFNLSKFPWNSLSRYNMSLLIMQLD